MPPFDGAWELVSGWRVSARSMDKTLEGIVRPSQCSTGNMSQRVNGAAVTEIPQPLVALGGGRLQLMRAKPGWRTDVVQRSLPR